MISTWDTKYDSETRHLEGVKLTTQPYKSTLKVDALKSCTFCWSDAGDFKADPDQFPKLIPSFSFWALDVLYSQRNVQAKILKIFRFTISSPLSWRLVLGILQAIRLVFVEFMCRPTSLAVRPRILPVLWCHRQSQGCWPSLQDIVVIAETVLKPGSLLSHLQSTQSSTVTKEKEPRCLLAGHLFWLSPDFHLTFSHLRELMTWSPSMELRFLYKHCLEHHNGKVYGHDQYGEKTVETKALRKSTKVLTNGRVWSPTPSSILHDNWICLTQLQPGWNPAWLTRRIFSSGSWMWFSRSLLSLAVIEMTFRRRNHLPNQQKC